MRVLLFTLALAEIVSTMGAAHFTLVMLMLYSKTCINHLKFYRQPKVQEPKVQKPVDQRFRSETQKQLSNKEVNKLIGLSDLDMYVVLMVQFRLVRGYVDTSTAFIMGSGFAMLITLNYVVIMLFGKIPLPLYLVILLLAILCPWEKNAVGEEESGIAASSWFLGGALHSHKTRNFLHLFGYGA
ncbi:hypothetical protein Fcan01_10229 [Folsomia candida]|uniref:Uncharacterized protein n=1 Tax=Folsomia candida TaxID=158441 RepID=A0A226EBP1_FOLCA|nr:hypothetical protein Fcan01_10229 [Folsomia candida]